VQFFLRVSYQNELRFCVVRARRAYDHGARPAHQLASAVLHVQGWQRDSHKTVLFRAKCHCTRARYSSRATTACGLVLDRQRMSSTKAPAEQAQADVWVQDHACVQEQVRQEGGGGSEEAAHAEEPPLQWMVRTARHLLVRLAGQDFTLAKFLQEELVSDTGVLIASCEVQPGGATLCVRTNDGTDAEVAVRAALHRMLAKTSSLSDQCLAHVTGFADTPGFRRP